MNLLSTTKTNFNGINLTTWALLLMFYSILAGCKKDAFNIEGITDRPFNVADLRGAGDSYITTVQWPTVMELNGDGSFTIKTDQGTCKGFYNWTNTSVQQAKVRFVITKWHSSVSEKLKQALATVETCYIDEVPGSGSSSLIFLELRLFGPGGQFTLISD